MLKSRLSIWLPLAWALYVIPIAAAQSPIYKIVDKDGNVSYTDVPPGKSQNTTVVTDAPTIKFESKAANNADSDDEAAEVPNADEQDEQAEAKYREYQEIAIVFPPNDEAVRANNGDIVLRASLVPALRRGHMLRFSLDNQPVGTVASNQLALTNVDRGTHDVRVDVLDKNNAVLKSSASSIFHLKRSSALSPTRKPPPAK